MLKTADIREWRGREVIDSDRRRLGRMEAVYVDTRTDEPSFLTVRVGLPTRYRLAFVPLEGATVGPEYVRVAYARAQVKDAPSIGTDGELLAGKEEEVFSHYGLSYDAAPDQRWLARR